MEVCGAIERGTLYHYNDESPFSNGAQSPKCSSPNPLAPDSHIRLFVRLQSLLSVKEFKLNPSQLELQPTNKLPVASASPRRPPILRKRPTQTPPRRAYSPPSGTPRRLLASRLAQLSHKAGPAPPLRNISGTPGHREQGSAKRWKVGGFWDGRLCLWFVAFV